MQKLQKKVFTKPKICFTIEVDIKQGKEKWKKELQTTLKNLKQKLVP